MKYMYPYAFAGALFLLASLAAGQPSSLIVEFPGSETMEFIWVSAGSFTMGTTEEEADALRQLYPQGSQRDYLETALPQEQPARDVAIPRGFYLGKYEVTQAQWRSVMGEMPRFWSDLSNSVGDDRPVMDVQWEEAMQFIHRLNLAAQDSLYRLPTEEEWEYACSAGDLEPAWYMVGGEEVLAARAWHSENTDRASTGEPVGLKEPNFWGFYDMLGNVSEWVMSELWTRLPEMPAFQSTVVRGGSTSTMAAACRCSSILLEWTGGGIAYDTGLRVLRLKTPETSVHPRSWGEIKAPSRE